MSPMRMPALLSAWLALLCGCSGGIPRGDEDAALIERAAGGPVRDRRLHVERWRVEDDDEEHAVVLRLGPEGILPSARIRFYLRPTRGGDPWTLLHEELIPEITLSEGHLTLKELSGDARPEILLMVDSGSGGCFYDVWRYEGNPGRWLRAADALGNPGWFPRQRCVIDWCASGAGSFRANRLVWQEGRLVPVEGVSQEAVPVKEDAEYEITIYRADRGEMREVLKCRSKEPHPWSGSSEEGWEPTPLE